MLNIHCPDKKALGVRVWESDPRGAQRKRGRKKNYRRKPYHGPRTTKTTPHQGSVSTTGLLDVARLGFAKNACPFSPVPPPPSPAPVGALLVSSSRGSRNLRDSLEVPENPRGPPETSGGPREPKNNPKQHRKQKPESSILEEVAEVEVEKENGFRAEEACQPGDSPGAKTKHR